MNEEEKQVLKTLKGGFGLTSAEQEMLVNYIDKLQKEIKELKEELQYYKDNIIEDLENRDRWE